MGNACVIGPFAVPLPPPNARHGRKAFDGGSLVSQQRAMVRAAFSGRCSVCGVPRTAVRPRGAKWSRALYLYSCEGHVRRVRPYLFPPHGPEHAVDVHIVRVRRYRGRPLDAHENLPFACKPIVDEITAQLWPKGPNGKPTSNPDDAAPWLRWSYGERPHRKARPPRKLPPGWVPGPPDPPNQGTELCEIVIAPREDCGCSCCDPLDALIRRWEGDRERTQDRAWADTAGIVLANLRQVRAWADRCGCGRSRLPIRWARGEL